MKTCCVLEGGGFEEPWPMARLGAMLDGQGIEAGRGRGSTTPRSCSYSTIVNWIRGVSVGLVV